MDSLTRAEGSMPEDLHLTRRAAAGVLLAGYAVAALSAEAAPIVTPEDGLITGDVAIPNGAARPLPAYIARPQGAGRHPVVIVASEVFGVHAYIKDICRRLAKLGYVAVAPSFFYRSGVDLTTIADFQKIRPIVDQAGEAQVDGDVKATTAWAKAQPFAAPAKIGITGFCWGGNVVWRAAMVDRDIRAGVAWYGRLATIIPRAAELHAPVLGLYAGEDKGIPLGDVEAMRTSLAAAGKQDSGIHVYPGAAHGFHADYRDAYAPAAAADGWQRMLAHFRKHGVG